MKKKKKNQCSSETSEVKCTVMDRIIQGLTGASVASTILLPLLFVYLNHVQPNYFIDEKFHIPQTLRYCAGKFSEWDPKITTLPGLYLFASFILAPLNLCTTIYLRLINLLFSYFNLFITYRIVKKLAGREKKSSTEQYLFLTAWNVIFLPPLIFWFFLYYTDIFSVFWVLIMMLFHLEEKYIIAALAGALSVLVRQTNIIWVVLFATEAGFNTIERITNDLKITNTLDVFSLTQKLFSALASKARESKMQFVMMLKFLIAPIFPYTIVLISFIRFVINNKGIVVGDKSAHAPTCHIMQVLYFSIFVLGFSWPYLLPRVKELLNFITERIILSAYIVCLMTVIVHYNTLVHKYILADNRHYSFYIWKNFMNRYKTFKYLPIPVYAASIYAILKSLSHLRLLSRISYVTLTTVVLVPQLLLEPRYFIIPYIVFRLQVRNPRPWQIAGETITTIAINIAQFALFVNKSFYWKDETDPQRIAW